MGSKYCPKWVLEIREKSVIFLAKHIENEIGFKRDAKLPPTRGALRTAFKRLTKAYEEGYYISKDLELKKDAKKRKFYLAGVPNPEKYGFRKLN